VPLASPAVLLWRLLCLGGHRRIRAVATAPLLIYYGWLRVICLNFANVYAIFGRDGIFMIISCISTFVLLILFSSALWPKSSPASFLCWRFRVGIESQPLQLFGDIFHGTIEPNDNRIKFWFCNQCVLWSSACARTSPMPQHIFSTVTVSCSSLRLFLKI
jgi:hypothetical protein